MYLHPRREASFSRYLSTWDIIPIVEGMKFSYDVRCEKSVYDNVGLDLRIVMPDGRKVSKIVDQNGIPMSNLGPYHTPSLKGKANGAWYHRQADLSALAGGWIDMITLTTTRPNGAPYLAGELNAYIDNISFAWPDKQGQPRPKPSGPAGR